MTHDNKNTTKNTKHKNPKIITPTDGSALKALATTHKKNLTQTMENRTQKNERQKTKKTEESLHEGGGA